MVSRFPVIGWHPVAPLLFLGISFLVIWLYSVQKQRMRWSLLVGALDRHRVLPVPPGHPAGALEHPVARGPAACRAPRSRCGSWWPTARTQGTRREAGMIRRPPEVRTRAASARGPLGVASAAAAGSAATRRSGAGQDRGHELPTALRPPGHRHAPVHGLREAIRGLPAVPEDDAPPRAVRPLAAAAAAGTCSATAVAGRAGRANGGQPSA